MNYKEILARIQKGEDEEAIVKEFTDNLNKAIEENNAAKEAAKADEAKSKKKDEIAVRIAHALNDYMAVSGLECDKLRAAEVREVLDELLSIVDSLKDIKIKVSTVTPKNVKSAKSIDSIFGDFFKELGI